MILKVDENNLQQNFLRSSGDKNHKPIKIFLKLDHELESMHD
jgi:hypothetical protein